MIRISRVNGTYEFPASFILCAAMNPCPCGYYPDMNRCSCSAGEVAHYLGKISQPLLDRIDLCTEAPLLDFSSLRGGRTGESSEAIRIRVEAVREIQRQRYLHENVRFNGELAGRQVEKYCQIDGAAESLLKRSFDKMPFSARSYHRILKVARTIADMDGSSDIREHHIGEALSYRPFDKKYWN